MSTLPDVNGALRRQAGETQNGPRFVESEPELHCISDVFESDLEADLFLKCLHSEIRAHAKGSNVFVENESVRHVSYVKHLAEGWAMHRTELRSARKTLAALEGHTND